MSPLRLFFDECCSPRLVKKLAELNAAKCPGLEINHLSDFFKRGDPDDKWLTLLKKKGEWIVVSADRGHQTKGAKLPMVCRKLEITHLLFSSVLVKGGYTVQESVMIQIWGEITKLPLSPQGTQLTLSGKKGPTGWKGSLSVKGKPLSKWCAENGIVFGQHENHEVKDA